MKSQRTPAMLIAEVARRDGFLEGVTWNFYERLLKELGERPIRVTFDNGRLELWFPSPEHEHYKVLVRRLLETAAYEINLPLTSIGSATLRREDIAKGIEADSGYYSRNEPKIRRLRKLNLLNDPPPDLVLEVQLCDRAIDRKRIYAAIGVPEIWRFDGERLKCLHLHRGLYAERSHSLSLPWLPIAEVERFAKMLWSIDQTSIVRQLGQWVRKHAPRTE